MRLGLREQITGRVCFTAQFERGNACGELKHYHFDNITTVRSAHPILDVCDRKSLVDFSLVVQANLEPF